MAARTRSSTFEQQGEGNGNPVIIPIWQVKLSICDLTFYHNIQFLGYSNSDFLSVSEHTFILTTQVRPCRRGKARLQLVHGGTVSRYER